ncbi:hypothetical protein BKP45_05055 [Anaerobacillus alkalidiazotrophicus]|uniref:Uncharacterized protein n=1 Tax=Anaerobacillus alkalidiazotrophicus TaxID=472963 RepID=A0A1S2MDV8_9BACI|nr:hypothetical protein [Anaerobacillus alkalidiazotrophicus]OIJ22047.1 hypothetical protein BKP45_05055 [Anaerobacillus alkalidiazotrophicus]
MEEEQVVETTETESTDENEQTESEVNYELTPDDESGLVWISDISRTKETIFYNPKGDIHVIHEVTLGDIATITLLSAMLIFIVVDRVIRR